MKQEADLKIEPKREIKEEEFEIKIEEDPIILATIRPIDLVKPEPVDDFRSFQAEPQPSSSWAIAEVRVSAPPLQPEVKFDPFDLALGAGSLLLLLPRTGPVAGRSPAATPVPPREGSFIRISISADPPAQPKSHGGS